MFFNDSFVLFNLKKIVKKKTLDCQLFQLIIYTIEELRSALIKLN